MRHLTIVDMFSMISFFGGFPRCLVAHEYDGVVSQVRVPLNTACELTLFWNWKVIWRLICGCDA